MVAAWILPIHLAFNHGSTGTGPMVAGRVNRMLTPESIMDYLFRTNLDIVWRQVLGCKSFDFFF